MRTIQLKVSDKVYDKLIWFLNKFSPDEVKIVEEDSNFLANKKYLHAKLKELNDGKAEYITLDELDNRLDKIISC